MNKKMDMEKSKIYDYQIIANLLAGKGLAQTRLKEIKHFLDKHQFTYRVLAIEKYTPISQIPENGHVVIKNGVICLGGDGTVSETIGYMIKRNLGVPIFIVPTGTANFIADSLKVKTKIDYEKLLKGESKKIDLGVCRANDGTHYFLIGIGMGFEQKFLQLTKEKSKKFLGKVSYFSAALVELFKLRPLPYDLKVNQQQLSFSSPSVSILNFKPAISALLPLFKEEDIRKDDNYFDIFYIEHRDYFSSFLGILFFHLFGKFSLGLVKRIKCQSLEVDSPLKPMAQIDGELKGKLPFKISILHQGVCFLV